MISVMAIVYLEIAQKHWLKSCIYSSSHFAAPQGLFPPTAAHLSARVNFFHSRFRTFALGSLECGSSSLLTRPCLPQQIRSQTSQNAPTESHHLRLHKLPHRRACLFHLHVQAAPTNARRARTARPALIVRQAGSHSAPGSPGAARRRNGVSVRAYLACTWYASHIHSPRLVAFLDDRTHGARAHV